MSQVDISEDLKKQINDGIDDLGDEQIAKIIEAFKKAQKRQDRIKSGEEKVVMMEIDQERVKRMHHKRTGQFSGIVENEEKDKLLEQQEIENLFNNL